MYCKVQKGCQTYVTGTDEVAGQALDNGVAVTTLLGLVVETDEDTLGGLDGSDTSGTLKKRLNNDRREWND